MEDDIRSSPPLANSENSNNVTNSVLPRDELGRFVASPASNSSKNSRTLTHVLARGKLSRRLAIVLKLELLG